MVAENGLPWFVERLWNEQMQTWHSVVVDRYLVLGKAMVG